MTAYQPELWHDMFVATAGAAAALTGLIFVAVSINLERVLKYRALPPRAVETLSILIGLLVLSVFVLTPGQSRGRWAPRYSSSGWSWAWACSW